MDQTKRHRDNDDNNNKRQKLPISTTTTDNDQLKTCFEDLSNDLLYEIFDYLVNYDIHQAFYGLNQRFKHLLINSTYPLQIHLSSISKFNFSNYYNQIIHPNRHRIKLFHLTNSFLAKEFFSFRSMYNNSFQVQTLILENILSEHIHGILIRVEYCFRQLSTLVVHIIDEMLVPHSIFTLMYAIPLLNSCKLTFKSKSSHLNSLALDKTKISRIKDLILNTSIYLQDIDLLLSHFPQLRSLSINYLYGARSQGRKPGSIQLNSLVNLNLKVQNVKFNQLEQLIVDYFSSIETFYLSAGGGDDRTYLNAQRWEQLITNHMKNLKVFDLQYAGFQRTFDYMNNQHMIHKFFSPFWIERQWRHDYTLNWQRDENLHQVTNFDQVNYLCINGTQKINSTKKYFPNVIELTTGPLFTLSENSIITTLNSVVCLSTITKLSIRHYQFPFKDLIQLLSAMIHLSSLKVSSLPSNDGTEDENDLCQQNMVKSFIIHEYCTLKRIQLLMNLFPRLEQFMTRMDRKEFISIMKFLLTNMKHLCFICVLDTPKVALREVKKLIKDTKIIGAYELNRIDRRLYLWW